MTTTSSQVAATILEQLGGRKFLVMTGAKNLLSLESGLQLKLPSNFAKDGINVVRITLTPEDEYNVEFGKLRGLNYRTLKTIPGVYWDMLKETFTHYTGLDTSL